MKILGAAFLIAGLVLSTPVYADQPVPAKPAPAAQAPKPVPAPVCHWPAEIPLNFTTGQVAVLNAWLAGQDYSHTVWQEIGGSLQAQENALTTKYCKPEKTEKTK